MKKTPAGQKIRENHQAAEGQTSASIMVNGRVTLFDPTTPEVKI
jgi:hypothetical protein